MNYIIKVNNLKKIFKQENHINVALNNVSFNIKRSEFVSLIGPDGAGKTTLIKILCGILNYDEGEVIVLDSILPKQLNLIKSRIGYLSQKFSLYGNLTVEENLNYFARIYNISEYEDKIEMLLEAVNLYKYRDRLARNLSGGMKQKLGVICGLIHSPDIFFLDEPTTGIDPISRREIFKLIEKMIDDGLTVIMSTSYMDEAERAHRVIMLDKGTIIQDGNYEELAKKSNWRCLNIETDNIEKIINFISKIKDVKFINRIGNILQLIVEDSFSLEEFNKISNNLSYNAYFVDLSMENLFIVNIIKDNREFV